MASWLEAEGTSEGTDLTSSSIQGLTKQLNRRKRKRSKTGQVEVDGADELEAASDQAAAAAAPAAGAAAAAAPAAAAAAAAGSDDDEDDEDDEIAWEAGDEADADPGWEDTVLPASPAPKRRRQQAGDDVVDLSIDDDEDNEGAGATAANGRALTPGAVFHSREIKVQPPGKCRFVGHAGRCTSSDEFQRFLSMIKSDPAYQDADSHTCAFRYHKLDSQGARQRSKGKARLIENSKDGDEKGAGTKLLDVLKQADAVGVVVIVSRWFGGTNLGKARFSYMVKAGCSVLAKVGYTNEAIGDGASEQHARTVSEAHLAQGMLSGFLGHAILHHAEAMVPARQDGVLNTLQGAPQFAELFSDLSPDRVTVKALSRLAVNFNSYTTRGLPHFFKSYGIVDQAAGSKQWGGAAARRGAAAAGDGAAAEDAMLTAWLKNRSTPNQCTLMFVALCRALSLSVRLVVGLDPQGVATGVGEKTARAGGGSGASAALNAGNLKRKLAKSNEAALRMPGTAAGSGRHSARGLTPQTPMWAEVMTTDSPGGGSGSRWVAVDPVHGKCDTPTDLIEMWYSSSSRGSNGGKGRKAGQVKGPAYVISVECCPMLRVTDVSRRYLLDWFIDVSRRVPQGWWEDSLAQVSCAATPEVEAQESLDAELLQQAALANAEKRIPQTTAGLKRHPLYCLKKQLKKTQTIRPGAQFYSLVDGECVYKTEAIQELKTEQGWRKVARQVKEGEQPHEQRTARPKPGARKRAAADTEAAAAAAAAAAEADDTDASTAGQQQETEDLYGTWQTEVYVPPVATNGEIPTNEHGNVELWGGNMDLLPGGCRHIDSPWIQTTCVEQKISYKEAFVGFETKDRAVKPKIQGIVVLEEDYDRLVEAHTAKTAEKTAKKKEKRDSRLLKRWGELIKLAVQQRRVQQEYGGGSATG